MIRDSEELCSDNETDKLLSEDNTMDNESTETLNLIHE